MKTTTEGNNVFAKTERKAIIAYASLCKYLASDISKKFLRSVEDNLNNIIKSFENNMGFWSEKDLHYIMRQCSMVLYKTRDIKSKAINAKYSISYNIYSILDYLPFKSEKVYMEYED